MIMKITPFHRTVYIKTMIVIYYLQGFSGRSDGKEFICNVGDLGSIPGLGRFPGEENGNSLQYSGLKNSTDRGASQATIHRVTKRRTRLSNFYSLTHYWASLVAQRYRFWMQCRRLRRCGFYLWVGKIPWKRAWQPTSVFLPENPMDRGAWWVTDHSVAESWTLLKLLNMHTCTLLVFRF